MSKDFTEKDLSEALEKITNSSRAISKRQGTGPSPLRAFTDGPPMQPAVLRSNLARFFKVFLTPKQVGALVDHFDGDGDGTVDGGEFLKQCNSLWNKVDSEAIRHMMEHRKQHVEKREMYDRLHKLFRHRRKNLIAGGPPSVNVPNLSKLLGRTSRNHSKKVIFQKKT